MCTGQERKREGERNEGRREASSQGETRVICDHEPHTRQRHPRNHASPISTEATNHEAGSVRRLSDGRWRPLLRLERFILKKIGFCKA